MKKLLLVVPLFFAACAADEPTECKITYEFTGSGADQFTATYKDNKNTIVQEHVTLPWTKSFTFEDGEFVSLGGNCLAKEEECSMVVQIKKGSFVADKQEITGGIASVSATWVVDCAAK